MAAPGVAVAAGPEDQICRICFDGPDSGKLLAACGCTGTQALVHEACLLRWRRVQLVQGKLSASQRCEICQQKYSASLAAPSRPLHSRCFDFSIALLESLNVLITLLFFSSISSTHIVISLLCFTFGIVIFMKFFAVVFPSVVLLLYTHGFKLSLLSAGGQRQLGLTSFGAPVEGLGKGMILVALGTRGIFSKTVLYVHEHSDNGSIAYIMNGKVEERQRIPTIHGAVTCCIKNGGPVPIPYFICFHNMRGVASSDRIDRERNFFVHQGIHSIHTFLASCLKQCSGDEAEFGRALFIKDVSSWGPRQLDGEMRRFAWGWIRPENVNLEDVFNAPGMVNRLSPHRDVYDIPTAECSSAIWERFVNHPHLEMFEG